MLRVKRICGITTVTLELGSLNLNLNAQLDKKGGIRWLHLYSLVIEILKDFMNTNDIDNINFDGTINIMLDCFGFSITIIYLRRVPTSFISFYKIEY